MTEITVNISRNTKDLSSLSESVDSDIKSLISGLRLMKEKSNAFLTELVNEDIASKKTLSQPKTVDLEENSNGKSFRKYFHINYSINYFTDDDSSKSDNELPEEEVIPNKVKK